MKLIADFKCFNYIDYLDFFQLIVIVTLLSSTILIIQFFYYIKYYQILRLALSVWMEAESLAQK